MKIKLFFIFLLPNLLLNIFSINAAIEVEVTQAQTKYELVKNVTEYKRADWANVIGRTQNTTAEEAKKIAERDPAITYFFYVKSPSILLEDNTVTPPLVRIFYYGDAVFFSGKPWWGSAPGLADGYIKRQQMF